MARAEVRGTFSQLGPRRPAYAGRLTRTLGRMTDNPLPPDVTEGASLRGNEYAWPVGRFLLALDAAKCHNLACLGGQFQFRTPRFVYEMYWHDVSCLDRQQDEPWPEYVRRSTTEVRQRFIRLLESIDVHAELAQLSQSWKAEDGPAPSSEDLCFVAYFAPPERPVGY